jgi:PAS domain S-box-containing protein
MSHSVSPETLLNYSQDKIALLNRAGEFVYVNNAAQRLLGYEPEELLSKNAFAYIHPEDVENARVSFERVVDTDEFVETTTTYRFRAADDSWVWFESRLSNIADAESDGYIVSSRDVTDRVRAERISEIRHSRLKEIASSTSDVLWMYDSDWEKLLFVSSTYEEVFGRPVDELHVEPQAFLNAVYQPDVPQLKDAMKQLSAGEPTSVEFRVNSEKNFSTWLWVRGEPIFDDGKVERIAGFTRDITHRKQRERQLYVMDNILRHNLRNDLNIILGNLDSIEEQSSGVSEETTIIRRTSNSLLATAEKQRTLIEFLRNGLSEDRIELATLLEESVETVQEQYQTATISVSYASEEPVHVLCDVGFAITELVENAIQHCEAPIPAAWVTADSDETGVTITIEDKAPPIPRLESDVLTGYDNMSDVHHNGGVGMWLVYWVVELASGDITVDAASDTGNQVTITLPR